MGVLPETSVTVMYEGPAFLIKTLFGDFTPAVNASRPAATAVASGVPDVDADSFKLFPSLPAFRLGPAVASCIDAAVEIINLYRDTDSFMRAALAQLAGLQARPGSCSTHTAHNLANKYLAG